ncbi:DUF6516 family protein [Methanocaldococcus sp. FS406-22]|uniref:toxin-antitoxin system TumE family protein n=1 Tax=Methanocaldococcus sp. (strain FS406-22) TaxID=644281 RepID=UPI00350F1509
MIVNYTLKSMFLKKIIFILSHWQDKNGDLIIRWDNAPHYKNIKTFPHHKHTKNGVEESDEVCLEDVLKYIENYLKKC